MSDAIHVVCPHCDTINRLPPAKLAAGGRCGECHEALFDGHPVELDSARFTRHLDKGDIPLLIDFWAAWCGPCRAMAPEFDRAAARLEPGMRLVKVNVDQEPDLAARFGIRSIPTMILARHGKELARTSGATSATAIAAWAQQHAGA